MRSKFILIVGCAIMAIWAVGISLVLLNEALSEPFGLLIFDASLPPRYGSTTTHLVFGVVSIVILGILLVWAVKRSRDQIKDPTADDKESKRDALVTLRERLRDISSQRRYRRKRSR